MDRMDMLALQAALSSKSPAKHNAKNYAKNNYANPVNKFLFHFDSPKKRNIAYRQNNTITTLSY